MSYAGSKSFSVISLVSWLLFNGNAGLIEYSGGFPVLPELKYTALSKLPVALKTKTFKSFTVLKSVRFAFVMILWVSALGSVIVNLTSTVLSFCNEQSGSSTQDGKMNIPRAIQPNILFIRDVILFGILKVIKILD